jgi:tRNA(Ile)-lysidine synthase
LQRAVTGVWPRRAEALARLFPVRRLHPGALAGAGGQGRWAVGFSGGPDSLALLLLLWAHWPRRRGALLALHFDHRLRGAASRQDARFCAAVCAGLKIRLVAGSWRAKPRGPASEAAARDARLEFFAQACRRARIETLWLGHQQDDIAETLLMRLARGSGTAGLAAPRPVSEADPRRVRPLLAVPKAELVAALKSLKIPSREDRSNAQSLYLRNRVRAQVLPAWQAASTDRDVLAGAALSRELLQEDDEALEQLTDSRGSLSPSGRLNLTRLEGAPRAVWRRALNRWVLAQNARTHSFRLSRSGFTQLLQAAEAGLPTRISMGASTFARIANGVLTLVKK